MWNIAISFVTALLSGMGVGGGGLFLLWLIFVTKTEQKTAQGINLLVFAACAVGSLLFGAISDRVRKEKRLAPHKKTVLRTVLLGGSGSFLGILLAEAAPTVLLRRCFGVFLLLAGTRVLLRKQKK